MSPGPTLPVYTAEPHPVPAAQPSRNAFSSGVSAGTLTIEFVDTVVYSAKVEIPRNCATGVPSSNAIRKLSGSSHRAPIAAPAPRSHRFWCPVEHHRHRPQTDTKEKITLSPGSNPGVSGPTDSMTPAPS